MDVEFKLFGSLTVKQFMSLAGGVIFAVFIYFLPIPWLISLPVIVFSVLLGFAMAFMTINGQSFGRWFRNFVIAMFSSQKYVWKKSPEAPKSLTQEVKAPTKKTESQLNKELGTMPIASIVQQKNIELDDDEKRDLSRIDKYFEAEFDKYNSSGSSDTATVSKGTVRVDPEEGNIAGGMNPIGDDEQVVEVGSGKKAVYKQMRNQQPRAIKKPVDADDEIETRIKEILKKQQELDPYTKTKELEKREEELRDEMRKLYNEVQKLKQEKDNG